MGRRILLVTGAAGESYETLYAVHRFREAGDTVAIAAPSRRRLRGPLQAAGDVVERIAAFLRAAVPANC